MCWLLGCLFVIKIDHGWYSPCLVLTVLGMTGDRESRQKSWVPVNVGNVDQFRGQAEACTWAARERRIAYAQLSVDAR
jgi:hypothetical protein